MLYLLEMLNYIYSINMFVITLEFTLTRHLILKIAIIKSNYFIQVIL